MINPELVKALEKNRTALNSAFEYFISGENRIESHDIFNVLTKVLTPVYRDGIAVTDSMILSIFKSLLKLIAKKMLGESARNREIESCFYTIIERYKSLLAEHGGIFITTIFNALLNLELKNSFPLSRWTSVVSSLPRDIDIDEFRKYGFITSWVCGAASASENSADMMISAKPEIIRLIFNLKESDSINPAIIAKTMTEYPWRDPVLSPDIKNLQPLFKTAGGFRGYGHEFRRLPVVASIDENFYATDGVEVFRLYADYYGVELTGDASVTPDKIRPGGVINRFIINRDFIFNTKSYPLPPEWKNGVSSIAFNSSTVIWTLTDSYKIYIAGVRG